MVDKLAPVSEGMDFDRLSNLLAVTDMALTGMSLEDLLAELVSRIRSIVEVDTVAVLLREEGASELVARAAWGLEDEVRQGVTVPIGVGFAGAIAARKEPVFIDRVDESTVTNPILWEKGVRVMLGVPLLSRDELIGVLHVGRFEDRVFTTDDAELLQLIAGRVSAAVAACRLAVEPAAALLLERGLQPTRLPAVPGLRLAGRYVPTESRTIGGDWYDAFVLPSGQLWLVVGDVAGHGLSAAVVMGRVKSALRAYALISGDPARALEMTDRKVQHFEIGTMVTVLCATATPPYEQFDVCSAGHLPPAVATPDAPTRFVSLRVGPPLGAMPDAARFSTTVGLPADGLLLLYTDGLVERRGECIDDGLERLRSAVAASAPEIACRHVMHQLVGNTLAMDDIALLAVQRT
jgi:putative methionine-R-sulfoxide reductase with GAF domain